MSLPRFPPTNRTVEADPYASNVATPKLSGRDSGLSPNESMDIVQADIQVESSLAVEVTTIPDGRYLIKNRAANIYWAAEYNPLKTVHFWPTAIEVAKKHDYMQVNKHSQTILMIRC